MIVITGATGQLGRAVVDVLLERVPAERLGVSVREPGRADDLARRGVRVRQADYADAAGLTRAFEGAGRVLLVSANALGEPGLALHRTAIAAARAAGVGRLVYTSHMGVSPTSLFRPMHNHAATEAMLRESGLAFTSLRNGFYTASGLMQLDRALQTGELAVPADGPVSWTAHADLARAAAAALTDDGLVDGPTPALTAGEALDLADVAAVAAELTGRPITRTVVPDAAYRETLLARGTPEAVADMYLGLFRAGRRGEFAAVDPALERLLGRRPLSVRDVLAGRLAAA